MRQVLTVLVFLAAWCTGIVAVANTEEENGDLLAAALEAVSQQDWISAEHSASQISDPIGLDLVVWARLRAGEGDWLEYQNFVARHGNWPGIKLLRKRAEAVIPKNGSPSDIRAFFKTQLPQTGTGALRLAEAFQAQGRISDARTEIARAWADLSLDKDEQFAILETYKGSLGQAHSKRMDNLLWKGWTQEASRMLPLVSPDIQKLAKARIGLRRGVKTVDALIANVPASLADDPGLAFDRFRWRIRKDRWDDAQQMLVERTADVKLLGRPEEWAQRRAGFARRAMRAGDHKQAYFLASKHGIYTGSKYADLEWLSGYLALRYLNAPKQALQHFTNFKGAVGSPISLGRAGYWMGRAQEALGDYDAAQVNYEFGAKYQTSFYGQLAAEKLGDGPDQSLAGKEKGEDWRIAPFADSDVMRAALLLHYAQEPHMVRRFFVHMSETMNRDALMQLSDLALEMDRPFVALGVAKQAAKTGVVLPRPYFPVTDLASYSADVASEVAMAIARRESELNEAAISPAGARGLMQVMPATARKVANDLGIEYSKARLTNDWRYNATLGTAYLASLLETYNGSYVLAFAAYNAGPTRANEWVERFGDPRDGSVDPIDWIEHVPYTETRNYIMRVIESLHVYRARLQGASQNVSLSADLNRG